MKESRGIISYTKRKNNQLFNDLKNKELMDMEYVQNYIPIYDRFFKFTETNYENVILDTSFIIQTLLSKDETPNTYTCLVETNTNCSNQEVKTEKRSVFCKLAPLIDPYKFMIGKMANNETIFNLPELTNNEVTYSNLTDVNNSAYTDGMFVYFSNLLNTQFGFVHGVLYYGSYLGIKRDFRINIYDDIEYLANSTFFKKHKNVDFEVEDYSFILTQIEQENGSCKNRPHIKINKLEEKVDNNENTKERSLSICSVQSIDNKVFDGVFNETDNSIESVAITLEDLSNASLNIEDFSTSRKEDDTLELTNSSSVSSGSTCSSRVSFTSGSDNSNCSSPSQDGDSEVSSDMSDDETGESEEEVYATLPRFPVEAIFMEKMEYTLDSLIVENDLSDDEWFSILMQVIMILITYQKVYSFTHNDLHTNNIMFVDTDRKYLYYRYNKRVYKVPTFGRIAKIIDFGRAIYKYDGLVMCSDSFKPGNDASTQYNTEPYFNEDKPRLEPNMSFDLCRLATSIYDELIDDDDDIIANPVATLINEWCKDDDGRNVLYKQNGDERYPAFKLYKMISRIVHAHTPDAQLSRPEFSKYGISGKEISTKMRSRIMDIDKLPVLSTK
jgi:hypothetical protein